MENHLDHLLWACASLEAGIAEFHRLTGVEARPGGSHPDFGTRNALAGLGRQTYLEIIAPDPAQALAGTWGEQIAAITPSRLLTFAVRTTAVDAVQAALHKAGLTGRQVAMSRRISEDETLRWRILNVDGHDYGDLMPFFIQWGDSRHPSAAAPQGLTLDEFHLRHPAPEPLRALFHILDVPVEVLAGERPELHAVLDSPRGRVELRG